MPSPDIAYLAMLALKMLITMLVVVGTSLIVERTGPFIGGMIATIAPGTVAARLTEVRGRRPRSAGACARALARGRPAAPIP